MARALLVLSIERFAYVIPTLSASSPDDILRFAIIISRFITIIIPITLYCKLIFAFKLYRRAEYIFYDPQNKRDKAGSRSRNVKGQIKISAYKRYKRNGGATP